MRIRERDYDGEERRGESRREVDGMIASLPTWAKFVGVVGVPGAIALYLVYVFAAALPAMQSSIQAQAEQQRILTSQIAEHMRQMESQIRLGRYICSNTAKTETERQRCFDQ